MEDPDPAVRIRLSQSVRFLLPETTGHSEQASLSEVSHCCGHSRHHLRGLMLQKVTAFFFFKFLYAHAYGSSWLPVSMRHSATPNSTETTSCAALLSSPRERSAGTGNTFVETQRLLRVFCCGESCLCSSNRASQGSLVSFSLLRLLHCLLSKSSSVSVSAYTQIRSLATAKGLKLQTLFSQYKNPICQVYYHNTKYLKNYIN